MPDSSDNVNARDGASIVWGPEIRVDGKRPEWLTDDQVLQYHDGHSWYGDSPSYRWTAFKVGNQQKVNPGDFDDWPNATAIRLPADHPHYSKAPTTPGVDWSRPIEAVSPSGNVVSVQRVPSPDGTFHITPSLNGWYAFRQDGTHLANNAGWRIRNVQPTTPELDPALWDRMVALVREMALRDNGDGTVSLFKIREHVDAAMSIVADLPKPVDPDLIEARKLRAEHGWAKHLHSDAEELALAAIKRGRQLSGEQA